MDAGKEGAGLTALRERVDERAEHVARLVERVEVLEEEVPHARTRARELEKELERAREGREGFGSMVVESAEKFLGVIVWLPVLIPVVVGVVALGMCIAGGEEPTPPLNGAGLGTLVRADTGPDTPTATAVGHTCELTLSRGSRRGRCRIVIDCAPPVFDGEGQCRVDHRTIGSGDDETSYHALVLTAADDAESRLRFDEDVGLLEVSSPGTGSLQLTVHRLAWDGEP